MLDASYGPANHCVVLTKITLSLTSGTKFKGGEGPFVLPASRYLQPCWVCISSFLCLRVGVSNGEL